MGSIKYTSKKQKEILGPTPVLENISRVESKIFVVVSKDKRKFTSTWVVIQKGCENGSSTLQTKTVSSVRGFSPSGTL